MGQIVETIFGGAQKPDSGMMEAQQRQLDAANKRQAELDAQDEARKRAAARGSGRTLLLGPAGELGVTDAANQNGDLKQKLGA